MKMKRKNFNLLVSELGHLSEQREIYRNELNRLRTLIAEWADAHDAFSNWWRDSNPGIAAHVLSARLHERVDALREEVGMPSPVLSVRINHANAAEVADAIRKAVGR